jgi:glycosyltransferase involved in cell wall biosynthesis
MQEALLMPVYNEAATVGAVLNAVRKHFAGKILVVDDGSTDETARILSARDDIAMVRLDRNSGYGGALRVGFGIAAEMGTERIVTMDCDGQHEPAHIRQFLAALANGGDIVSGSRYLPGSPSMGVAPEARQDINAFVIAEINRVTHWGLTDAFCGFKAYRLAALHGLQLREPGYAMPLELWAKAWRCGLQVREIPVERIYCDEDRSFGSALDEPGHRLAYYMEVWNRSLQETL